MSNNILLLIKPLHGINQEKNRAMYLPHVNYDIRFVNYQYKTAFAAITNEK